MHTSFVHACGDVHIETLLNRLEVGYDHALRRVDFSSGQTLSEEVPVAANNFRVETLLFEEILFVCDIERGVATAAGAVANTNFFQCGRVRREQDFGSKN